MNDNSDLLTGPFRRLLADISPPSAVRAAEAGGEVLPIWQAIEQSGFLDALVPEDQGGSGLTLDDVFPLVAAAGEYCLPVPFGETVVARGLLANSPRPIPNGASVVLSAPSAIIPLAGSASHALGSTSHQLELVAIADRGLDMFGTLGGQVQGDVVLTQHRANFDMLAAAAALAAAKMTGAMHRILAMTLQYAGERSQFGRPLAKFQAIQQQLAVMAEQVASAQIAARIGFSGSQFDPIRVAMAKCRVSEASHQVVAIAHAVHGAIGVTEEYDLQLFTRRIKEWHLAFGSEPYWAERVGRARLAKKYGNSADFVRIELSERNAG